jgi:hypothetical protein
VATDTSLSTTTARVRLHPQGEELFARAPATAEPPPQVVADPAPAPPRRGIPHFPALEGLRGLAVVGVVLFHARIGWMQGGFLGVSTFFTLSGFLITSLLLAERWRPAA